ncbi:hypothetical protein HZS_7981 [Henneguya salminicola]|nr:hypothetical protein HZS_7981 [Henneguya salminicola]
MTQETVKADKTLRRIKDENNPTIKPEKIQGRIKFTQVTPRKPFSEIQPSSLGLDIMSPAGQGPHSCQIQSVINPIDDESERIRKMLCSDDVNEEYWKEVAEQRRSALAEVCEENKELYKQNYTSLKRMEILEAEVSSLFEYKILYKIFCLSDN